MSVLPHESDGPDDRKQAEADFHNERARARATMSQDEFEKVYSNKKWYYVTRRTTQYKEAWFARYAPGAVALDYCCGQGLTTIELAKHGATAHGIDISADEVQTAARQAADAGVQEKTHFQVMDAEHPTFPSQMFDLIVCNGVLHHLDVEAAYPELARMLKPGGRVLCMEALGYNPIIQWYRNRTPHLRTAWEKDHILTLRQVKQAQRYFNRVSVRYFFLFTILAVPFRKSAIFKPVLRMLELLDEVILRIPGVQLMAWQMYFELSEPRHTPAR